MMHGEYRKDIVWYIVHDGRHAKGLIQQSIGLFKNIYREEKTSHCNCIYIFINNWVDFFI